MSDRNRVEWSCPIFRPGGSGPCRQPPGRHACRSTTRVSTKCWHVAGRSVPALFRVWSRYLKSRLLPLWATSAAGPFPACCVAKSTNPANKNKAHTHTRVRSTAGWSERWASRTCRALCLRHWIRCHDCLKAQVVDVAGKRTNHNAFRVDAETQGAQLRSAMSHSDCCQLNDTTRDGVSTSSLPGHTPQ